MCVFLCAVSSGIFNEFIVCLQIELYCVFTVLIKVTAINIDADTDSPNRASDTKTILLIVVPSREYDDFILKSFLNVSLITHVLFPQHLSVASQSICFEMIGLIDLYWCYLII